MNKELREAAKKYKDLFLPDDHYDAFIAGATWQESKKCTLNSDMVDFANWISRDWMSIWVEDKWMWEYQNEVGPHHPYFGYLTSEQLFKMYLVDKNG